MVLAGVLMVSMPAGPGVSAQTQTDVDKAQQEADRTKAALGQARQAADTASLAKAQAEANLMAKLDEVDQTTARLDAVASKVIELRGEIEATELTVRELRRQSEERAVEAYMSAWSTDVGMVVLSADVAQVLILEDVAATAREDDLSKLNDLSIQRRILDQLRTDQETEQANLQALQEELSRQADELEQLFAQADEQVHIAYLTLDAADRKYQEARQNVSAAKKAYEDAQRRIRIGRGVERWRPLVEKYFPASLVGQALAVMQCESGGNPDAVNRYSGASGLFQFLKGTWAVASTRAGFGGYSRFDPEANIAAAAWLVDYSIRTNHPRGAWGHWSCQP